MRKDFNKRNRLIMYQMVGILLLCIGLISLFSSATFAWLRDESFTSNGEPNISIVGTLSLKVTTNFNFYNLALAPDRIYTTDAKNKDIATYVKTDEEHDIDGAYVRIKFENKRAVPGTPDFIDNFDLIDLYFNGNRTYATSYSKSVENMWFYNATDNFYYYIGGVYDTNVMFNAGYKTTNSFTNTVEDLEVRFTYQVESVQRQYGAYLEVWTTAPQIFKDFANQDHAVHLS